MNYALRTHHPETVHALATHFDALVQQAWQGWAQCTPNAISLSLAHLSARDGGLGFTRAREIAEAAYRASVEAASPQQGAGRVLRQADHVAAENDKIIATLDTSTVFGVNGKRHRQLAKDGKAIALFRDVHGRVPQEAFSAALRFATCSALEGTCHCNSELCSGTCSHPVTCPCGFAAPSSVAFAHHAAGCAKIPGHNASSRHAKAKHALQHELSEHGVLYDSREPREYATVTCPGCKLGVSHVLWTAHEQQCALLQGKPAPFAAPPTHASSQRPSGPDVRVYPHNARPMVVDITIISLGSVSYADREAAAVFASATATKSAKYAAQAQSNNECFKVLSFSAQGVPSIDARKCIADFVDGAAAVKQFARRIGAAIFAATGSVIANAEARAGLTSNIPLPQPRPAQHRVTRSIAAPPNNTAFPSPLSFRLVGTPVMVPLLPAPAAGQSDASAASAHRHNVSDVDEDGTLDPDSDHPIRPSERGPWSGIRDDAQHRCASLLQGRETVPLFLYMIGMAPPAVISFACIKALIGNSNVPPQLVEDIADDVWGVLRALRLVNRHGQQCNGFTNEIHRLVDEASKSAGRAPPWHDAVRQSNKEQQDEVQRLLQRVQQILAAKPASAAKAPTTVPTLAAPTPAHQHQAGTRRHNHPCDNNDDDGSGNSNRSRNHNNNYASRLAQQMDDLAQQCALPARHSAASSDAASSKNEHFSTGISNKQQQQPQQSQRHHQQPQQQQQQPPCLAVGGVTLTTTNMSLQAEAASSRNQSFSTSGGNDDNLQEQRHGGGNNDDNQLGF
jgi:hypothetical protein